MAQYKSKWWMETSKRIKARDHNTCQMCGCNDKPLSVHHLYYGEDGSLEVPDRSLITLCDDCHKEQKDYREDCNALIDEMRQSMTDSELYQILSFVLNRFCPTENLPIWLCNIDAELQIPDMEMVDGYGGELSKIHNLRKWRTRVRKTDLAKEALQQYFLAIHGDKNDKDVIEKWFNKTYGKTIAAYMDEHIEEAREIETNIKQHLEKQERR